jgi:membrane associated rhomboid family serine protease
VVALTLTLCAIHILMAFALTAQDVETVLELFAFNPLRYHAILPAGEALPGGVAAAVWTFVTYAFLHANLTHLAFNLIWLVAFGTPVARRFGPWRFLAFFAFTAAAGALAHLVSHLGQDVSAIGASAAVLGMMAAAMRFVFQPGGPLGLLRLGEENTYRVPAKPLGAMLRDRRALLFVLVWFGLNALLGQSAFGMPGIEEAVAWQAHIGGFLAGLLAFTAFDPIPSLPIDRPMDTTAADGDRPAADDQDSTLR